ncbi:hypothetical protein BC938DRAFT_480090 [Jimgerdemannia flammicorona]|uniref:RNI-like protein n=1 Tax=Jimgerdemannia flammicorona TaxID=994334 RepID=A0A433QJE5_9FUNG|nr:hypothetical protein BC938DRAFT_480090 [Jimgerdemannia flammicorona]
MSKEKTINEPLLAIAEHAGNLTSLELYLCDRIMGATVLAFITIHQPISPITHLSLPGCHCSTDTVVLSVAAYCPNLHYLDLRACRFISDVSIVAVARACPQLYHLNVGRFLERDRITDASILEIARLTQITVLGLAGCDITDECILILSEHRGDAIEAIYVGNCPRITYRSIRALVAKCKKLRVFRLKECHHVRDWEAVGELVQRGVLLGL